MNRLNRVFTVVLLALIVPSIGSANQPVKKERPRKAEKAAAAKPVKLGQYKRVHQKALDMITAGQSEKAVEYLLGVAEKAKEDAETQFMLAIAHAQLGQLDQMEASLMRAFEFELPPERLLAGPRDLLGPLAETRLLKILREEHPIIHGPMLGSVTDTSASIWVRTAEPGKVTAIAKRATVEQQTVEASAESKPENDFTAVIRLTGLTPSSTYGYEVECESADGNEEPTLGVLKTAPAPGSPSTFKLAFGGGAGFVPAHEHMWTTIRKTKPDLLLLLGDNVYSDNPTSPHQQRYCYYRRQSRLEYRQLLAYVPVYSIWDDHDFGTNDCAGGPAIDEPAWKRPVWKIFAENWANPGYGGGADQPGVWYTFHRGDVQFIMLDGRYYRDRGGSPPSMLGPVQKAWLKETLKASTATFKVLCSPVPWDFRTKGDSRDTWNGFQEERGEIFSFAADNAINGIVLMSADRHRSDAWQIERPDSYDLYEFNSSRLTNQHVHSTMPAAIFSYNKKQSFGLVSFDTTLDDPAIQYDVITIDGEVVHTLKLKLSQLTAR